MPGLRPTCKPRAGSLSAEIATSAPRMPEIGYIALLGINGGRQALSGAGQFDLKTPRRYNRAPARPSEFSWRINDVCGNRNRW